MTKENQVPVLELRRLLFELKDLRPDICVRFRLIGEMWQTIFLHVALLYEKGVNLHDESGTKFTFIPDLADVMQFELDRAFKQYRPHNHYNVDPALAC